jgi:hypothetical protein
MGHRLQQNVAQFLVQRPLVSGLQRFQRLVGLLEQVRRSEAWVCRASHGRSVRSLSLIVTRSIRCAPSASVDPCCG